MKNITITTHIEEYDSASELNAEEQRLLKEAGKSAKKAYAPYSGFNVGAAVLLENGNVISGNNQENAASPSGLCAERVAVYAAGANYPGIKIKAIAISAFSKSFLVDYPVTPCGGCRQALIEYESRYKSPIRLILSGEEGKIYAASSVKSLLPLCFDETQLNKPDK